MPTWKDYESWLSDNFVEWGDRIAAAPLPRAIQTDSRHIATGQWFLPLKGERFDGHAFIAEAMAKGALGFFYQAGSQDSLPRTLLAQGVAVRDTLAAYQAIGRGWRETFPALRLVALTGSSGKTTTREMTTCALEAVGPCLRIQQNFNNEIGVPISLCQLSSEHRFACFEFGARHVGDIRFLNSLARPNVCALLNIGSAHVGEFGGPEKLRQAKMEMLVDAAPGATLVVPADDTRALAAARELGRPLISFGETKGADVRVENVRWLDNGGMEIAFHYAGATFSLRLGCAHDRYPINAAAACAMTLAAGGSMAAAIQGLSQFTGVKGRFVVHRTGGKTIIDDTYNANPESMRAGLQSLKRAFLSDSRVIILGDMLELGENAPSEHERIGEFCAREVKPAALIAVGELSPAYLEGAKRVGLSAERMKHYHSAQTLISDLNAIRGLGDIFYLKGSNGIRLSQVLNALLTSS